MCGQGRLLVNVVFSLTGIFHGSAGGMSSGHTWHWGTPDRSYQIPLGKPGLVIPRCETLASRSVTFPLHQRKVQRCTPSTHPPFLAKRICNWGSKGKKEKKKKVLGKGEGALLIPPTTAAAAKLCFKIKFSDSILSSSCCTDHETVLTQLVITNTSSVRWETLCCICAPSTFLNWEHAVVSLSC